MVALAFNGLAGRKNLESIMDFIYLLLDLSRRREKKVSQQMKNCVVVWGCNPGVMNNSFIGN